MPSRRIRTPTGGQPVTLTFDGRPVPAFGGEPVAASLLAAGVEVFGRSIKYHRPRGPTCGAGICSQCMMRVDGVPNVRTCSTPARDGMVIESQNVLGGAEHDVLGITDWLFPRGIDHHEMFTGVPLVGPVVQKVVRKLGGLGTLPARAQAPRPAERREVDVLVVGAGASGLAAAAAARETGVSVLVVEARGEPGGRRASGLFHDPMDVRADVAALRAEGVDLWTGAIAQHVTREDGPLEVVVVRDEAQVVRVRPRRLVLANGAYHAPGLFGNNDLPGVLHAAFVATLAERWGVLAGERVVLCGDDPELGRLPEILESAGARIVRRLPASAGRDLETDGPRVLGVEGSRGVRSVQLQEDGRTEDVPCDLVVLAFPGEPGYELPAQAGARVSFDPECGGFAVRADAEGRTAAPDVFACGSLLGRMTPAAARASGLEVGAAAASGLEVGAAASPEGASRAP